MTKAIITVLLGKYDELKPAPKFKDWETVLFTDHHYPNAKGWTLHKVKSNNPGVDSRYYKWLTHLTLPMYNTVCYMDASMELKCAPPNEPTWFRHPARLSVDAEAKRIIELEKAPKQDVIDQLKFYKSEGFKDDLGLYQNGFFVRTHDVMTNALCETIYTIVTKHTYRDQLAMPYALFKNNYKLPNIKSGTESRKYFNLWPHTAKPQVISPQLARHIPAPVHPTGKSTVHHITPGRSDLNLGKAINDIVKVLPDNDWICLRDIDTMPAYHEPFFKQIEDIAATTDCGLVSCMTNRLGLWYQLHGGKYSTDTNWMNHRNIGKERFKQYGHTVEHTKETVAGLMMLFPKKVWLDVGGFPEGNIQINGSFIDFHFSVAVAKKGHKVGIAPGVYMIHMYRPDAVNPRMATQHLIKKAS